MKKGLKKEIEQIIIDMDLNCSIEQFKDKVKFNWFRINIYHKLSEDFIREFKDYVDWRWISEYQKLSESFIREFKDEVYWGYISMDQKLSEEFIREFKDKAVWYRISEYQKLSEDFIREFKDKVNWYRINKYQKLSEDFIKEFDLTSPKNNMRYWTTKEKLKAVKKLKLYEIIDDKYILAYKAIRSDRYSFFNFQYQYLKGKTYESHCDYNNDNENSFGLSAWTENDAKNYNDNGLIVKVKINIKDLGAIVHDGGKLRCSKITILN